MPKRSAKKKSSAKSPKTTSSPLSGDLLHNLKSPIDTKTLVTILLLVFAYPIGLVAMLLFTRWPLWVKVVAAIPAAFVFFFIFLPLLAVVLLVTHKYDDGYDDMKPVPVVSASPSATPTAGPTLAPTTQKLKY